ncbi:hypothetical protein [Demequina aurantiaca]|uniref:hypothetical protein n=1 Tax=Demequina aurantiaca TaxID=676200 RepID=UPI003D344697
MRQTLSLRRVARLASVALFAVSAILFVAGQSIWWVVAAGVFGAAVWIFEAVHAHRHRSEYAEFALLHGWDFAPRTTEYNSRFASAPFAVGGDRQQLDVLRGKLNGLECATFTHVYETGGDEPADKRKHPFQVTLVELPVNLPRLELIPESLAQRVAKTVGAMDIDFESEAFNRRWRVRAADRKYAHDVLDPRMLERLIQPDAEGAMIRIEGGAVMTWQSGRVGVEGLATRLGVLTAIARRIPDHVLREYTERGLASRHGKYLPDGEHHRPLVGPDWATTPGVLTSGQYTGIGVEDDDNPRV